jgi:hypothetical protein
MHKFGSGGSVVNYFCAVPLFAVALLIVLAFVNMFRGSPIGVFGRLVEVLLFAFPLAIGLYAVRVLVWEETVTYDESQGTLEFRIRHLLVRCAGHIRVARFRSAALEPVNTPGVFANHTRYRISLVDGRTRLEVPVLLGHTDGAELLRLIVTSQKLQPPALAPEPD